MVCIEDQDMNVYMFFFSIVPFYALLPSVSATVDVF